MYVDDIQKFLSDDLWLISCIIYENYLNSTIFYEIIEYASLVLFRIIRIVRYYNLNRDLKTLNSYKNESNNK